MGIRKYDLPAAAATWTLAHSRNYLDATAFGEASKTYILGWKDQPKVEGHYYSIQGEFQGEVFFVDTDLVMDSPVEAVVREVLKLGEGDELMSIAVRHADGTVTVRPWDEG